MDFIDLFAGLGGFHLALQTLGHTCVFASEINPTLQKLYEKNFGLLPVGDIRHVPMTAIPAHDILCAGFPCQPFSKAGDQQGTDCPKWGDLFTYVLNIIKYHKPKYVILENVPNLEKHNQGHTWCAMRTALETVDGANYQVEARHLSPHHFGIPQIRQRMFIVASRLKWPALSRHQIRGLKGRCAPFC